MAKATKKTVVQHKRKAVVIRLTKEEAGDIGKILKGLKSARTASARAAGISESPPATRFFKAMHKSVCESPRASGALIVVDIEE